MISGSNWALFGVSMPFSSVPPSLSLPLVRVEAAEDEAGNSAWAGMVWEGGIGSAAAIILCFCEYIRLTLSKIGIDGHDLKKLD